MLPGTTGQRTQARSAWLVRAVAVAFFILAFQVVAAGHAVAKYASYVIDADTGRVLHSINADTRNYPASLTKMMTLYLLFNALEEHKLSLNSRLKVSAHAARMPPSHLALRAGSTISVRQAILALVTKSANDAAVVVAESLARNERSFAQKMTATARKLGMTRTTFRNASGLPNRGQMSTARDMATLARALIRDHPEYYHFFSRESFRYDGTTFPNHNKLLNSYEGTDGIKTGYIRASGYNLVASVKRNGHRLIGVIFGGRSSRARNHLMVKLMDQGFDDVSTTAFASSVAPPPLKPSVAAEVAQAAVPDNEAAQADPDSDPDAMADSAPGTLGQWGVQVGVYATRSPADQMARKAVETVPDLLDGAVVKVVPLNRRHGKKWYRARILGLEKADAYRACRLLRHRKMSCMELHLKKPLEVAAATD